MIDYMLDHKTGLNKYNMIKIILNILSDHNKIKIEFNNRRET